MKLKLKTMFMILLILTIILPAGFFVFRFYQYNYIRSRAEYGYYQYYNEFFTNNHINNDIANNGLKNYYNAKEVEMPEDILTDWDSMKVTDSLVQNIIEGKGGNIEELSEEQIFQFIRGAEWITDNDRNRETKISDFFNYYIEQYEGDK